MAEVSRTFKLGFKLIFGLLSSLFIVYWYSYTGLATVAAALTGSFIYDVQKNRVIKNQGFGEAVRLYTTVRFLSYLGFFMRRKLDQRTKNIQNTQEETLLKQLKIQADTEYGKRYNFSGIHSASDFIQGHPLTRYSHFDPYIERMVKGEQNIITSTQPVVFGVTSGTSGKSNILPMLKGQSLVFLTAGVSIVYDGMLNHIPGVSRIQKSLKLFYNPKWRESASGIKIGPNSSTPARSKDLLHMYSTPAEVYDILSEPEALYCHLLFALKDRHIGMVEANFSSLVFNSFKRMEEQWQSLVSDIEKGELNPRLKIDEDIREKICLRMKPDPARAEELRKCYVKGTVGLACRIWPDLNVVIGADTGTFEFYGQKLRETYLKGVLLYSPIYAASEGLLGINIWPGQLPSRYLLAPTAQFFEFIPVEKSEEAQPETLLMHQVKLNQEYELVITNLSCMYRYRFGDVIKVTDFYNQCPVVEFKYRQGQFLNVRAEKTSESSFYAALKTVISGWSQVRLMDYCCAESIYVDNAGIVAGNVGAVPCYHVFLEVEPVDEGGDNSVKALNLDKIDETLCAQSYVYSSFRKKGSIGPMKVHLVKPGSFADLRQFMINNTLATSVQFKVPRVLKRKEVVSFMMDHVSR